MKLQVAGESATGTGIVDSQNFSVSLNAKAFHTLSSTLYKDKFGAIIREICSNAYDAHIMVGTPDRPFSLTFPDVIDSELVIRDFGPGISPEDIINVFCRFFESTKDDSNEQVGAYGLGAKTPYSYTDTFTVTSIYDGVKYIYAAYKDAGMPRIKLMSQADTDEESGFEVSIPVDRRDLKLFEQAVLRELRFFPVKPLSNRDWEWPTYEVTMDFGSVQFYKATSAVLAGFFVQVGPVGYPIDRSIMENYCKRSDIKLSAMASHLFMMGDNSSRYRYHSSATTENAILQMPIGTVEVQPSREGLHYTNDTCQNIIDAISDAEKKIASEMRKRMDEAYAKSTHEFYKLISNLPGFLRGALASINDFSTLYAPFTVDTAGRLGVLWDVSVVGSAKFGKIYAFGKNAQLKTETERLSYEIGHKNVCGGLELFRGPVVYFKDEAFAYKSRIFADADERVCVFIEPDEKQDADAIFKYFEQYLTIRRVSDTAKNVKRVLKSRSGGRVRSWYDLGDRLSRVSVDVFSINSSLYVQRIKEVFDEELNDIDVPTVVLRTVNNFLKSDSYEQLRENLRLAAILCDAGYQVIAIPATKTYKNENLCEIDKLTEEHHKAIRDFLAKVSDAEVIRAALLMARQFNRCVELMSENNWVRGDHSTLLIPENALKGLNENSNLRKTEDFEVAKKVSGATDVEITFDDVDSLFAKANTLIGVDIVPSKKIAKLRETVSLKDMMKDLAGGNIYAFRASAIKLGHSSVREPIDINGTQWLIEAIEGLD